jgi:hypothetical protein
MLASEWPPEKMRIPRDCWCTGHGTRDCICDMERIMNDPSVTKNDMVQCRKLWSNARVVAYS